MAFTQISAPTGPRPGSLLSADNIPERHIVMDLLRRAAPVLGLRPPVVATLDALLSCLPPKRNHHTVFASNATLTFRRNGISDRTIRRHVATLQDTGLLVRRDSPNGKRYARHHPTEPCALRFGFDLTPLFDRLQDLTRLAVEAVKEQDTLRYLRCKLRAIAADMLDKDPSDAQAHLILKTIRRKQTCAELDAFLATCANETTHQESAADLPQTHKMSTSDGQNVRHHHNSKKELIDKKEPRSVNIAELLTNCSNAAEFAQNPVRTTSDVIAHGRTLAPMIGIDEATYHAAQSRLGPLGAAVTVWAIMQFHDRLKRAGAYFRSITTGKHAAGFDPFQLVARLGNPYPAIRPAG